MFRAILSMDVKHRQYKKDRGITNTDMEKYTERQVSDNIRNEEVLRRIGTDRRLLRTVEKSKRK